MKKSCSISDMELAISVRAIHDLSRDPTKFGPLIRARVQVPHEASAAVAKRRPNVVCIKSATYCATPSSRPAAAASGQLL